MGMAQIKYARNESSYLELLDRLYSSEPQWVRKWLGEEFNFRIYISPKTLLSPIQAANYLGYSKVFELTQKAFRNEVPSHFNPNKARMSFFKEELDNWALVLNRFQGLEEEIALYPDSLDMSQIRKVEVNFVEDEEAAEQDVAEPAKPQKVSTRVEDILRQIRESKNERERRMKNFAPSEYRPQPAANDSDAGADAGETGEAPKKRRRGRPPKSESAKASGTSSQPEGQDEAPKRRRGRPPKNPSAAAANKAENENPPVKKKRGRPKKTEQENAENSQRVAEILAEIRNRKSLAENSK